MNLRDMANKFEALLTKLLQRLEALDGRVDALRSEFEARRRLPVGDVAWDAHVTLKAAAGKAQLFDLPKDHGRLAVGATVISATNGALIAMNGSDPIPALVGQDFDRGRIAQVRLDNKDGAGDLEVVVFLITTKAGGVGAWA